MSIQPIFKDPMIEVRKRLKNQRTFKAISSEDPKQSSLESLVEFFNRQQPFLGEKARNILLTFSEAEMLELLSNRIRLRRFIQVNKNFITGYGTLFSDGLLSIMDQNNVKLSDESISMLNNKNSYPEFSSDLYQGIKDDFDEKTSIGHISEVTQPDELISPLKPAGILRAVRQTSNPEIYDLEAPRRSSRIPIRKTGSGFKEFQAKYPGFTLIKVGKENLDKRILKGSLSAGNSEIWNV